MPTGMNLSQSLEKKQIRGATKLVLQTNMKEGRDEIARVLTACRGRVGGADGAAARLGVNRTTLLWRMKKYGIYAKQYA
jgi:transcriptional regulator of acetoin/glycerol metabolism